MRFLALFALVAFVAACGRHVVLDPIDVVRSNDPTWKIMREPNPDGGAAPDLPVPPP